MRKHLSNRLGGFEAKRSWGVMLRELRLSALDEKPSRPLKSNWLT